MKLNYKQLPVKAHYFFFMAAMGPILPFLPVYGKQMGISPLVMGSITAILPILFLIAKPSFGFLVDRFRDRRKSIFIALLIGTSSCYVLMYFLPPVSNSSVEFVELNSSKSCSELIVCDKTQINSANLCDNFRNSTCRWTCNEGINFTANVLTKADINNSKDLTCSLSGDAKSNCNDSLNCDITCDTAIKDDCLYSSVTFWCFIILMSIGNIGFNVSNSISDAICFDVLGEGGEMGYGRQRVWGTIGFGITALLAGYSVDLWSNGQIAKTYTPAFILVFAFCFIDVLCCRKLELPIMTTSSSILKDVFKLVKSTPIIIFLCFATLAGILDSFLIYFLFWYLEDLAIATGHMGQIKLIEGLIVASETLGGEVIFFSLSGKILKKLGFGYTFVLCFVCYAIRLGLISLVKTPWWVIPIELFMQGPTYALCYTTIVAYASVVAPVGASATVQGIVAGMDDGFGFAVGSLIGGILYKKYGGVTTLRVFSAIAVISAIMYFICHVAYLKRFINKRDPRENVQWTSPEKAAEKCVINDS